MSRILVTYASRFGTTKEIAEAIADELTAAGFEVDSIQSGPQIELARYDAVVIGSPSYGRNWLPSASLFVVGYQDRLARVPVALFTSGTLGLKSPKSAMRENEEILSALRDVAPAVNPVSAGLFHGSFSRKNLPLCLRIVDWFAGTPQGDHRDWDAIRGWAQRVAGLLDERLAADGENSDRDDTA